MVQGEGSVNSSAVGSDALAAVLRERTNSLPVPIPVPMDAPKSQNDQSSIGKLCCIACLDLTETERECMTLDVSGHYSRPDLFRFSVAEERRE